DAAELAIGAVGEGLHLAPVPHVAGHRQRAPPGGRAHLVRGGLAGGELAAGAGDEGDLAGEVEEPVQHSSRSASSTKSPTTTSKGCAASGSSAPRPGP